MQAAVQTCGLGRRVDRHQSLLQQVVREAIAKYAAAKYTEGSNIATWVLTVQFLISARERPGVLRYSATRPTAEFEFIDEGAQYTMRLVAPSNMVLNNLLTRFVPSNEGKTFLRECVENTPSGYTFCYAQ